MVSNAEKRRAAQRERMRVTQKARRLFTKETGKEPKGKAWDEYREKYLAENLKQEQPVTQEPQPAEEAPPKPVDTTITDSVAPELKVEVHAQAGQGKVYVEGQAPPMVQAPKAPGATTNPPVAGLSMDSRVAAWKLTAKYGHKVVNGVVAELTEGEVRKTDEELTRLDEVAYAAIEYYAQMGKLPEMNPLYTYVGALVFSFGLPVGKYYARKAKEQKKEDEQYGTNSQ